MNNKKVDFTKKDCLLYDEEKDCCKGLNKLFCAMGKRCNFYKNGTQKKKKAW